MLAVMSSGSSIVGLFTQYLHGFTAHRHFDRRRVGADVDADVDADAGAHGRVAILHAESSGDADQTGGTIMGSSQSQVVSSPARRLPVEEQDEAAAYDVLSSRRRGP